jgi:hypothetical protein
MYQRMLLPLAALVLAACASEPEPTSTADEPGLFGRMWESTQKLNPLQPKLEPREMKQAPPPNLKSLQPSIIVEPTAPKLSEVRQMKVSFRLLNQGKRLVRLDFPTTQRIEVVIKTQTGKVIERWSEDRRFENDLGTVTVNPNERLEYNAQVATREMSAGDSFVVEAWMPSYDTLRASATVAPVK